MRKSQSACPSYMTSIRGNTAGLLGGEQQVQVRCCQEMYLLTEAGFYPFKDVLSQEGLPTLTSTPHLPGIHMQTLAASAHPPVLCSVQEPATY